MEDIGIRGSALPRPVTQSKLPQIRPNRASTLAEPGAVANRSNGTASTAKRSSVVLSPSFNTSPQKPSASFSSTRANRASILFKPGFTMGSPTISQTKEESIDSMITSPTKQTSRILSSEKEPVQQRSQPSLSDRTTETLSSIPPSPSPAKRRQSGFFATESPGIPPSRAASALAYSRPPSQLSSGTAARYRDPPSPSKKSIPSYGRNHSVAGLATTIVDPALTTRRAISGGSGVKNSNVLGIQTGSRISAPIGLTKSAASNRPSMIGGKTMVNRPAETRSPVKDVFSNPPVRLAGSTVRGKPATTTLRNPPANGQPQMMGSRNTKSPIPDTQQSIIDRKIARSSQTLRNSIQQARMRRGKKPDGAFIPRMIGEDNLSTFGADMDAKYMDLQDSVHVNIIRKRTNMAKLDGKLNISMLCLSQLPKEVLSMYEGGIDEGGPAWYETVDLVRLNAADNELTELPENVFAKPGSTDEEPTERDASTGIFSGLEIIDLHENRLTHLPVNLGVLTQLTSLNLSRNNLQCSSVDIIAKLSSLRELRLSQNKLNGSLPPTIGDMQSLELLDMHGNMLTELPSSIGKLSVLKFLNVSENRITSLPFEAIFDLHLVELNVSKNKLSETLIPGNVSLVPYLQKLNLCSNSLIALAESKVDFPSLQFLDISHNRVSTLPNMSGWQSLTFLNAEENKISEIPTGFCNLKELTHADFGNNSLLELDDAIGSMEKLVALNLSNNPIRERRLPKLTIEELKTELKSRANGLPSASSDRGGITPQFSTFAQAMVWTVQGNTLDRANSKLKTVEKMDLEPLLHENIQQCILHHNQLQIIPQSLELLAHTLVSLDLSNNKLNKGPSFLLQPLNLPKLQTLNLTLNGLTTLHPLLENLEAPHLATLIITFNKITSLPTSPSLTSTFPALTKLVATNNKITLLDVDALRGLQVLDVSSNEIEMLPPQLALLEGTLRTLIVNGNKFRVPSWGVLEKGTEEVLRWCRRQIPKGEEGALEAEW